MSTNRLEAFSDGVIAIAITLLVLDIKVPPTEGSHGSLAHALGQQWPSYAAYVISFLTIGIIWINHHAMIRRATRADHKLLTLNLFLLLTIGVLPFTTALMAEYLRADQGQHLAAAIYASSFVALSIAFFSMHRYLLRSDLVHDQLGEAEREAIIRRNGAGLIPYLVALAAAPLSPYVTVAICGAVAGFYALPSTTADAVVDQ